jgi:hypothetical protein
MRRRLIFELAVIAIFLSLSVSEAISADWDARKDVIRLSKEAPSLAAFPGVDEVTWLSAYSYSLRPDGGMEKVHRRLELLGGNLEERGAPGPVSIPFPSAPDASLEVTAAAWHNPSTGEEEGSLETVYYDRDGVREAEIAIPEEALGSVIAIETRIVSPRKYYLDDQLVMAGSSPIWEQRIEIVIPQDMDFYWQGTGVRSPERSSDMGIERISWTVMNQPAWKRSGILDEHPPSLVFSLRRGLAYGLSELRNLENSIVAPPVPAEISRAGSPQKSGENIAAFLRDRMISFDGRTQIPVRGREFVSGDGPWTAWEGTLIAGKWLESLGYSVKVFWSQKTPVRQDGPDSAANWREPVLVLSRGSAADIYFTAGQSCEFGRLSPSLYGAAVYRFDGNNVNRITLPRGNASDHTLTESWRLGIDENGVATGSLDITVTGGWVDIISNGKQPSAEDAADDIQGIIEFGVPGIRLKTASISQSGNGYRMTFGVRAPLGIVSGRDILMRIPGGVPVTFGDIPNDNEEFVFSFPFVFEQNIVISTPKGYRAVSLPAKTQHGDSKAMINESIVHWEKRAQVEASSKWIVRSAAIDQTLAKRVLDQLALARGWARMTVPLRK